MKAVGWGVLFAVVVVAVTGVLLSRDRSLARLQQQGSIRIGYAVEAPYAYLLPSGEVSGESPETAKIVVARLGIPHIEWRQVEFDELIHELKEGRIDVIAAGMFATDARAKQVRFSVPTLHVRPGLLVGKGNPYHLRRYADLVQQTKIKVAVLAGSVEEELLERLGVARERLVRTPDAQTALDALNTGTLQAVVLSEPTVRWMAAQVKLGTAEVLLDPLSDGAVPTDAYGHVAFAFRTEDVALQQAWDRVLLSYLQSSEHHLLLQKLGLCDALPCRRADGRQ